MGPKQCSRDAGNSSNRILEVRILEGGTELWRKLWVKVNGLEVRKEGVPLGAGWKRADGLFHPYNEFSLFFLNKRETMVLSRNSVSPPLNPCPL